MVRTAGLIAVALLVVLAATEAGAAPAGDRALLVTTARDFKSLRDARRAVEALGGTVQGMAPPSVLLVRLDRSRDKAVAALDCVRHVRRGRIAEGRLDGTRQERLLRRAWNARRAMRGRRRPALDLARLGNDVLQAAPAAAGPEPPAGAVSARSVYTNSRYLTGDCVVTIFLTESSGATEASTEDWTEDEEARVTAEIQEGLGWLADTVNAAYNANVTFIYDWHYREPTKVEPISTRAASPSGNAAAYEIMQRNGYTGSTYGGHQFNAARREQYGADMAFTIFVADSSNDSDGYFADGYIAYAYLGGPWVVQNYRNNGWGPTRMNQVTAHETGHIFGAGDEYAAAGQSASKQFGYLQVANGNSEIGGAGAPCVMLNNALTICKWTAGHLGLNLPDTTGDNTPDCLQYDSGGLNRRDQLAYANHTVDDDNSGASTGNGNGLIEAGETVEIRLTLRNDAFVLMRGVTAAVSTDYPGLTVTTGTAAVGDVSAAGAAGDTTAPFVIAAGPSAADGTAVLAVTLSTDQGWQFAFTVDLPVSGAEPDEAPSLTITAPADGLSVQHDEAVTFAATATDPEDGDLGDLVAWSSSRQGAIGAGASFTRTLTPGTHVITAWVTDSAEQTVSATVTVTVEDPPDTTPPAVPTGLAVTSIGDGAVTLDWTDNTEADLDHYSVYRSDDAGASYGRIAQPAVSGYIDGTAVNGRTYLYRVSASDETGNESAACAPCEAVLPDEEPTVAITSPAAGATPTQGDAILFAATATDREDGDLAAAVAWTSSRQGAIGAGTGFFRTLETGEHVITASVTDSAGHTAADSVAISVKEPADTTPPAAPKGLRVVGIDGGSVTLDWTSNTEADLDHYGVYRADARDGPFVRIAQPETSIYTDSTAVSGRTYYYSVTASDAAGNESDRSLVRRAVLPNDPPTLVISSPESGLTVPQGTAVTFSATAVDREDGLLSDAVAWSSSIDGALGTGASITRTLAPGAHAVTASVSDSGGSSATKTVTVTVVGANAPPTVAILAPASGAGFTVKEKITLTGTANDAEDGDLKAAIAWRSSIDGDLGAGASITVKLAKGAHTITATVTDSAGVSAAAKVTITVALPSEKLKAPEQLRSIILRGPYRRVIVYWRDENDGETGYRVERADDSPGPRWHVVGTVKRGVNSFAEPGVPDGTHLYRVRAVRGDEVGPPCEPIKVPVKTHIHWGGWANPFL